MHNLTLIEAERLLQPEPPSYFEYNARRTLPGDKTWEEYHKALMHSYHTAQLEECLRLYVRDVQAACGYPKVE